jgi:hypothetical protein
MINTVINTFGLYLAVGFLTILIAVYMFNTSTAGAVQSAALTMGGVYFAKKIYLMSKGSKPTSISIGNYSMRNKVGATNYPRVKYNL